jgi:hypothetical protein
VCICFSNVTCAVDGGFYSLGALADRWAFLPRELISYGWNKLVLLASQAGISISQLSVSPEFITVVEDRVYGTKRDSAFLTVLDHGGIISFSGILILLFFLGSKIYSHINSSASSVSKSFAVLLFFNFVAAGIHGRVLQAFPVWLVAAALVASVLLHLTMAGSEPQ